MKYYSFTQKIKLILLTGFISGAFFYSFNERAGTFFAQHPAYKKLLKESLSQAKVPNQNYLNASFPYTKSILRDLKKINQRQSFFDEIEMRSIDRALSHFDSQLNNPSKNRDTFQAFRGTWQGKDQSIMISRDAIKHTKEKDMNLQYIEFRGPKGNSVYGLNSIKQQGKLVHSKIVDGNLTEVFERVGVIIDEKKIIWLTKLLGDTKKNSYRISVDQVMDGLLNVKSVDIDFKEKIGIIDKVNFSSHQFSRKERL